VFLVGLGACLGFFSCSSVVFLFEPQTFSRHLLVFFLRFEFWQLKPFGFATLTRRSGKVLIEGKEGFFDFGKANIKS